jgi:hypothetical protein
MFRGVQAVHEESLNYLALKRMYCAVPKPQQLQGAQKVYVQLIITVQKHAKIFLTSFNHLPL